MSILTKLFSGGAAELIKGVGGVIDHLHTSKEEKLAAEQKIQELVASYEVEMEKQISNMNSIIIFMIWYEMCYFRRTIYYYKNIIFFFFSFR